MSYLITDADRQDVDADTADVLETVFALPDAERPAFAGHDDDYDREPS